MLALEGVGLFDPTGWPAILLTSFLSSTLLPGGSEVALLYAANQQPESQTTLWLAASLGNTLGGLSSWLIGWWLARRLPQTGLKRPEQRRAKARRCSGRFNPVWGRRRASHQPISQLLRPPRVLPRLAASQSVVWLSGCWLAA